MMMFEEFGRKFMTYSDSKWRKWAFKSPLVLWRMGLGPIMGSIFSLITVTGRKSGKPRHFLTEYYRDGDRLYVACAYGEKAQWYKNLMADPRATVQTWMGTERMKATLVTDGDEILKVVEGFRPRDPLTLHWYFEQKGIDLDSSEDILANKDRVHFFRFEPTEDLTPLPLTVDLAWIWPLLMLLGRQARKRRRRRD